MKKNIFLLIVATLILSACNLPANGEPPRNPESVAVETAVVQTLTAQPTATTEPTNTAVPPTATTAPTSTPAPTQTLAAGAATQTPADDPRAGLGDPVWKDTLDKCTAFGLCEAYDDGNNAFKVESGKMILSSASSGGFRGWRLAAPQPQDFYLEATFRTVTCSGNDGYGLVFRAPDYDSGRGYYLSFTCDGQYSLGVWDDGGFSYAIKWTHGDAITAGAGQTNRMGVRAEGDQLKLYANGKLLQEIKNSALKNAGHIGVSLGGFHPGFTVEMDEIAYWKLR